MLIEFERSPHVQEFSVGIRWVFLRLAAASLQDSFLLESQTMEDLGVIWKPWFSADSSWWTEFFFILRSKLLVCRFFFSGALSVTLGMHTSTATLLLHSRREVGASKTVKGPKWVLFQQRVFLIYRAHFLLCCPCYSHCTHNLWARGLDCVLAAYTVTSTCP